MSRHLRRLAASSFLRTSRDRIASHLPTSAVRAQSILPGEVFPQELCSPTLARWQPWGSCQSLSTAAAQQDSDAEKPIGSEQLPADRDSSGEQTRPPHLQGKLVANLFGVPGTALRHDVAELFARCNLRPGAVSMVLDERFRRLHWRLAFDSERDLRAAEMVIARKRRMGARPLALEPASEEGLEAETHRGHPNRVAQEERGRTLLVTNIHDEVNVETLERFFYGFHLAPRPFKILRIEHEGVRTPLRKRVRGEMRPFTDVIDVRVLVKFGTELEALRALREKCGEFLNEAAVELRLVF